MKLIGSVLLMTGGLAMGLAKAWALKNRVAVLTELRRFMAQMRTEILYAARPLGPLILMDESQFAQAARRQPGFHRDPAAALKQAGAGLLGNEKDRQLFSRFAEGLGASGAQGQLEHFQLYEAMLDEQLAQAQEECREKYRLYTALGLFAGMAVCIVII